MALMEYTSDRIYRAGYAMLVYNTATDKRTWRFRGEEFTLPAGKVKEHRHKSLDVVLADIEEVRNA